MLASGRAKEITGLLLHNDKSLHVGTCGFTSLLLSASQGTLRGCLHPCCTENSAERVPGCVHTLRACVCV